MLIVSSFLFSSSLSLFFSDPLLLYHLSSPFLSSPSHFLLLGLPISFSVMLISSFLPYISSLFLLVSIFFFVLCRHKSFVNVNMTYVTGSLSFSLSLSIFLAIIFSHHCHHHGPVQPSPSPTLAFLSLLSLYPFSPFVSPSHPILNHPNSILALSLSTPPPPTHNHLPSLSSFSSLPTARVRKHLINHVYFFCVIYIYTYI